MPYMIKIYYTYDTWWWWWWWFDYRHCQAAPSDYFYSSDIDLIFLPLLWCPETIWHYWYLSQISFSYRAATAHGPILCAFSLPCAAAYRPRFSSCGARPRASIMPRRDSPAAFRLIRYYFLLIILVMMLLPGLSIRWGQAISRDTQRYFRIFAAPAILALSRAISTRAFRASWPTCPLITLPLFPFNGCTVIHTICRAADIYLSSPGLRLRHTYSGWARKYGRLISLEIIRRIATSAAEFIFSFIAHFDSRKYQAFGAAAAVINTFRHWHSHDFRRKLQDRGVSQEFDISIFLRLLYFSLHYFRISLASSGKFCPQTSYHAYWLHDVVTPATGLQIDALVCPAVLSFITQLISALYLPLKAQHGRHDYLSASAPLLPGHASAAFLFKTRYRSHAAQYSFSQLLDDSGMYIIRWCWMTKTGIQAAGYERIRGMNCTMHRKTPSNYYWFNYR